MCCPTSGQGDEDKPGQVGCSSWSSSSALPWPCNEGSYRISERSPLEVHYQALYCCVPTEVCRLPQYQEWAVSSFYGQAGFTRYRKFFSSHQHMIHEPALPALWEWRTGKQCELVWQLRMCHSNMRWHPLPSQDRQPPSSPLDWPHNRVKNLLLLFF